VVLIGDPFIMLNLDTKKQYLFMIPVNVNGLVNSVFYYLQHNNKQDITIEQVKEFFRTMHVLDFHIFKTEKMLQNKEFWSIILPRVMTIYQMYFRDAMTYFECDFLIYNKFTNDIEMSVSKMLNSSISVKCPYFNRNARYDHDYLMEYVCMGKQNKEPWYVSMFNLRHAVMLDEIESFIPRIYGGKKLTPFTTVYNRANVQFIMDEKIGIAVGRIINDMLNAKEFLYDVMQYYFDDEQINNFLRYIRVHKIRCVPQWYNDRYNNNINIQKFFHYTNMVHFDNLEYCKEYFTAYIENCYACH